MKNKQKGWLIPVTPHLNIQKIRISLQNVYAQRALKWAKIGDWDALADYIRDGGKITKEIAGFIADVLEGNIRRPANKAQTAEGFGKVFNLVRGVQALMKSEGVNQSAAIDEIAEREKISRRTIERALQRREIVRHAEQEIENEELLEKVLEAMRKKAPPPMGIERYRVSETALTATTAGPHFMS